LFHFLIFLFDSNENKKISKIIFILRMNIVRCNIQQFSDAKRSSAFSQMPIYMSYDATDFPFFYNTLTKSVISIIARYFKLGEWSVNFT